MCGNILNMLRLCNKFFNFPSVRKGKKQLQGFQMLPDMPFDMLVILPSSPFRLPFLRSDFVY